MPLPATEIKNNFSVTVSNLVHNGTIEIVCCEILDILYFNPCLYPSPNLINLPVINLIQSIVRLGSPKGLPCPFNKRKVSVYGQYGDLIRAVEKGP